LIFTIRFFGEEVPPELAHLGRKLIELPEELLEGLVKAMDFAGVVDRELEAPLIPEWPPMNLAIDPERADRLDDLLSDLEADDDDVPGELPDVTPEEQSALAAYVALARSIRAAGSPIPGRVPRHKFQSPESWHVTPAECENIAQGLSRLIEDEEAVSKLTAELEASMVPVGLAGETMDWLPEWQAINAHAARRHGYVLF
jgi:hypothetical protein